MKTYILSLVVALCLISVPVFTNAVEESSKEEVTTDQPAGSDSPQESTKQDSKKEEKKRAILSMKDKTLAQLFETNPEAKAEVEKSVGYAVFDATGVNVILVVGVKGKGVAVDNATNKTTFMTMARAGTGPGVGYKDYRMLLVFKSKDVFNKFISLGMDAGASADATMKMGGQGKEAAYASSFNPYVKVFQITDKGLLLQANWGGTKFLKDKELNELAAFPDSTFNWFIKVPWSSSLDKMAAAFPGQSFTSSYLVI